jgi:hypothetical protein
MVCPHKPVEPSYKYCGERHLTLILPTPFHYISLLSLIAIFLPSSSPAITCILYLILPSERNFDPHIGTVVLRTSFAGARLGCFIEFCRPGQYLCK